MSSGITDGSTQRQVLLPGLAVGVAVVVAIVGTLVSEVLAKSWDRFVEDYESVLAVWVLHSFTPFGVSGLVVDQPEVVSGGFPGFVAGVLVLGLVGFGVAAIGTMTARSRVTVLAATWLGIGLGGGLGGAASAVVWTVRSGDSGYFSASTIIRQGLGAGLYWGFFVGLLVGLVACALWRGPVPTAVRRGEGFGAAALVTGVATLALLVSTLLGEFADRESTSFGSGDGPLFVFVLNASVPLGQTGLINDLPREFSAWLPGYLVGVVVFALVVFLMTWAGLRRGASEVTTLVHTWLGVVIGTAAGALAVASMRVLDNELSDRQFTDWSLLLIGALPGGYYWGMVAGLLVGAFAMVVAAVTGSRRRRAEWAASSAPDSENHLPR